MSSRTSFRRCSLRWKRFSVVILVGVTLMISPRHGAAASGPGYAPAPGIWVLSKDSTRNFPTTAVGQTSAFCFNLCYCSNTSACNCDRSGTLQLNHNVSVPFRAYSYRLQAASSADDCTGGTPVSLPVSVGVGKKLSFIVSFSPIQPGSFTDYLNISGYNLFLNGQGSGSSISILSPSANQQFALSAADNTATAPIPFKAGGVTGAVNWKAVLEYQTSGKRPATPFQSTRSFQTSGSGQGQETYTSQGGKVTVTATSQATGARAAPVTFMVTGAALSPAAITTRLVSLYANGATPRLITGVADQESSYLQFKQRSLYGISALWPLESYDGGSHIGLLQMPTAAKIDYAWNWKTNTSAGVSLFKEKLASAQRIAKEIIKNRPGLRALNQVELEHMALVLYGPYASADRGKQYYAPVQTNGAWKWVVNTASNSPGVTYANSCFSRIHAQ